MSGKRWMESDIRLICDLGYGEKVILRKGEIGGSCDLIKKGQIEKITKYIISLVFLCF